MLRLAFGAGSDGENREDLCVFGGAEGDRTPDLMSAIHALSQLSYSPASGIGRPITRVPDSRAHWQVLEHHALEVLHVERLADEPDRGDGSGPLGGVTRGAERDD